MAIFLSSKRWPADLPLQEWNRRLAMAEHYGAIAGWDDVYWHLDGTKLQPVEVEPGQLVWGDQVMIRPMGSSGAYRPAWKFELYKSLKRALQGRSDNARAVEAGAPWQE